MIEKMSNYILDNVLYKNENVQGDQREIMLFGITRIIEDIPKYLGIFIIALLLDLLNGVAIVLLITLVYKSFVGGAHARTNFGCFISSLLYFILPALIAKYLILPESIVIFLYVLLFIFSSYVIIKIAPADTEEIPIINKNKRKLYKALAFVSLTLIYIVTFFFIKSIMVQEIILFAIFYINIFTTKPFYKLFRCIYSYESEEFKQYFN